MSWRNIDAIPHSTIDLERRDTSMASATREPCARSSLHQGGTYQLKAPKKEPQEGCTSRVNDTMAR